MYTQNVSSIKYNYNYAKSKQAANSNNIIMTNERPITPIPLSAKHYLVAKAGIKFRNVSFGTNSPTDLNYENFVKETIASFNKNQNININTNYDTDTQIKSILKQLITSIDEEGKFLGTGCFHSTKRIPSSPEYIIRYGNHQLLSELAAKDLEIIPETTIRGTELNLGQPIARIINKHNPNETMEIRRFSEGISNGLDLHTRTILNNITRLAKQGENTAKEIKELYPEIKSIEEFLDDANDKYISELRANANMPQVAYDYLAGQIKWLRDKDLFIDNNNPNNILRHICDDNEDSEFHIIDDLVKQDEYSGYENGSVRDLVRTLMDTDAGNNLFLNDGYHNPRTEEIAKYSREILNKTLLACHQRNLRIPFNSEDIKTGFKLAGVYDEKYKDIMSEWNSLRCSRSQLANYLNK